MANTNTITTNPLETAYTQPITESAITALLKTPLGAHLDLFQILDSCQFHIDALIENDDNTECMALCGRLYAALEMLKFALKAPLPAHLIERLTVDVAEPDNTVHFRHLQIQYECIPNHHHQSALEELTFS